MASVFPKLTESMEEAKQSIFAPQPGQTDPNAVQSQAPEQGGVKTSTAGEIQNAGVQGQGVGTGANQQQQAEQQALGASVGKVKNPGLIEKSKSKIATADQTLQDEANKYVSDAGAVNYGVGNDEIEKGLGGDTAAMGKVRGTLTKAMPDARPVFQTTADLNQGDVDQLQTDAGTKSVLKREGGDEYTGGMAGFDLAALRRTPGFDQLRSSLNESRNALRSKADTLNKSTGVDAAKIQAEHLKSSQDQISKYLNDQDAQLRAANAAEAAAATAKARAVTGPDKSRLDQLLASYRGGQDPALLEAMDKMGMTGVDASKFWQAAPETSWEDMVDATEAGRFGKLQEAMGRGGPIVQAGRGARGGSFDENKFKDDYMGLVKNKRQSLDDEATAAALAKKKSDDEAAYRAGQDKIEADRAASEAALAAGNGGPRGGVATGIDQFLKSTGRGIDSAYEDSLQRTANPFGELTGGNDAMSKPIDDAAKYLKENSVTKKIGKMKFK